MDIKVNNPQVPSSTTVSRLDAELAKLTPKRGTPPTGSDAVQLSDDVRLADEAVKAASEQSDVRPEAVARARALLEQGQLGADLGRLADRIIDSLGDYDWNGDGNVDLFAGTSNVHAFAGDGTGIIKDFFNFTSSTATVPGMRNYTTADMTGDGKTDVITVGSQGLVQYRSTGLPDGGGALGYAAGVVLDASANFLTVNAIDVNADGRRDLIVTADGPSRIAVKLKNADGTYSPIKFSALTPTLAPKKLRMADFNFDGRLDAAVLGASSAGSVDIAFGKGDGTFLPPTNYALNVAADMTVGDFDFDGRVDVAFTLPNDPGKTSGHIFGILRNRGDGTLQRADNPTTDAATDLIDSADFNGDGKADLIVRYAASKKIAVFINNAVARNVIKGAVFNDLDQDQVWDGNEPALAGRQVFIDFDNDGVLDASDDSTTTLANGTWELRVADGSYRIRQQLVPRWIQTTPYTIPGQIPSAHLVTVAGIITKSGNNFGTYDRGSISGVVYNDYDGNSSRDPRVEVGRPGQIVFIDSNDDGVLDLSEKSTATDANGRFKFVVDNGTYRVRQVVPTDWLLTGPLVRTITIASSADFTTSADFGQSKPATISGLVYYDYAANGRIDTPEDTAIGGVKVFVDFDNDGVIDGGEPVTTTRTVADAILPKGGYQFTGLQPKTYFVRIVTPAGYQPVSPEGGSFMTSAFGGFNAANTDFGIIQPVRVSGRAYRDSNANGVIDGGETNLPDVPVFIDYDGDGVADLNEPYVLTDVSGNYTLTSSRQGTFNVRAIRRSGFNSTVPGSSLYSVVFTYGAATITGKNFGFREGAFSTAPYQAPINIATGANPTALAAGDFNGDGKQDFIVASNSSISQVFLGQGNGLFTPGQQLFIGESTRFMIAVDVSGDGKPDLVAANEAFDFGASVLIGNGNGTFQNPVNYAVTTNTYGVAAADFNGDGKRDLAYVGTSDGRVAILTNKGTGAFNAATFVNNTSGGRSIFAGDVNGDGKADLVVANQFSNAVSVLLGNGNATFTRVATDITSGINQPNFVTLADLNKDGKLDLVVLNEFAEEIRVKLGNGNGTFTSGKTFDTGPTPTQVAVLDIDRDGFLDLIVSCRSDGTTDISGDVSIHRGRGDGTFVDRQTRTAHTSPTAVAIADYNNDGKLDIVAANFFSDDVSLLFNGTPGALGSIKGTIWNDTDNDGVIDATERALAGQTVFADTDNDGVYDPGERFVRSASNGTYALLDLPAGTYRVRVVTPATLVQTSPANLAANVLTLSAGQAVTGKHIGVTPILVSGKYVFDDRSAVAIGTWTRTTGTGQYGGDYLHDGNTGQGTKSARFDLKVPVAGYYQVEMRWVSAADRASNAPVDITNANGKRTLSVNQRVNGNTWVSLGTYFFNPTGGNVTLRNGGANGFVVADAVRLSVATPAIATKDNADGSGITKTGTWTTATTPTGFNGSNYLHDGNPATKGGRSVKFAPTLAAGGVYEIFGRWVAGSDRASNARYDIVSASGTSTVLIDQRTRNGIWVSLGFFDLNPATVSVTIRNDGANGLVVADAVRFVLVA